MRLYRRENGIYYIDLSRGKKISTRTRDRRTAEKIFREFKKAYYEKKLYLLSNKKDLALSKAIQEFYQYQLAKNEESTAKRYLYTLNHFISVVGDISIRSISRKEIEKFFAERQIKAKRATLGIDFRNLRAFFNFLVKNEYLEKSPIGDFRIKQEKTVPVFLSKDEVNKLFDIIKNETYKVLFALYIYTGRRRNEILNLTLNDIDMKNHTLRYYNQKKKMYNIIPIVKPLQEILYPYLERNRFKINGHPDKKIFLIKPNTATHQFKKYFKEIGREDLKIHSLRHTFASHLIMSGASLKDIQELLDHSEISTTIIYTHVSNEYRKNILERLRY